MPKTYLVSSESVTEGHPDKVADQISDAVLDAILSKDKNGRVACETLVTTGLVVVAGEITYNPKLVQQLDIADIARKTILRIGYNDPAIGFDGNCCGVITSIKPQSPHIAMGVDETASKAQGAGDQGMMYGYATDENSSFMPTPILLAHRLCERLAWVRRKGRIPYLRPDGKAQVTVEYAGKKAVRVHTVVVSTQHDPKVSQSQIRKDVIEHVIKPVIGSRLLDSKTIYHVNPTGCFAEGGPKADCGVTGRKIIVDTYGGIGRHGGGAFSGKDPSKVDRSACYAARHIAKNVVAAGLARQVEIQVAYAIGVAEPVSLHVEDFGTATVDPVRLEKVIRELFDMTPRGIIERLKLKRPIYEKTAAYGHFGRSEDDFTWEKLDYVSKLKRAFSDKASRAPAKKRVARKKRK
jgi:S-adenosylmethionine synthetase